MPRGDRPLLPLFFGESHNNRKKIMNRIIAAIVLGLMMLTQIATAQKQVVDELIANVGTEIVLLSDLEEQYSLLLAQQGTLPPDARCAILEQLLTQKLLVNQAKLDSVEVSDDEVEAQLNARIEQILSYMNNDVRQFEEYYGQTIAEVKEAFREDLRDQMLAERMRSQIVADITVTPSEVVEFYNRIPHDSLPYFNSEVEVSEIVVKPQPNAEEKAEARQQLEELRRRIVEGGEDFGELARKYSDDFGSARLGGDLGWAKRGKFVPEFEAAAYRLEPGEISDIVETEFGYHIIQLLERRGNQIHTRHILIKPRISQADVERAIALLDSVRMLVLADSMSFSEAVKRFGTDDVQSYNNDGRMVNPRTGNTFFEIADLDPDVYFAIDTLEVGGVTQPFTFTAPNGEKWVRIVKLESRSEPHRASLSLDYAKIRKAAIEAKKNEYLYNWVMRTIRNTFIHVDQRFLDMCPNLGPWVTTSGTAASGK